MGHLRLSAVTGPRPLATFESVSFIPSDNYHNLSPITSGAITLCGDIVGPVSFEAGHGPIFLIEEQTREVYRDLVFDEDDEDGPLITSINNCSLKKGKGTTESTLRHVERCGDHRGYLSILPIAHFPVPFDEVYSLMLYQPLG